jgi:hypothetical protein
MKLKCNENMCDTHIGKICDHYNLLVIAIYKLLQHWGSTHISGGDPTNWVDCTEGGAC